MPGCMVSLGGIQKHGKQRTENRCVEFFEAVKRVIESKDFTMKLRVKIEDIGQKVTYVGQTKVKSLRCK